MWIEVQPKDRDKKDIFVKYLPIGACKMFFIVDGKIDLSLLDDTKYGKYIIGAYDDKWDSYTIALSEEGQALWKEEEASISRWMAKWGCD